MEIFFSTEHALQVETGDYFHAETTCSGVQAQRQESPMKQLLQQLHAQTLKTTPDLLLSLKEDLKSEELLVEALS